MIATTAAKAKNAAKPLARIISAVSLIRPPKAHRFLKRNRPLRMFGECQGDVGSGSGYGLL